MQLRRPFIMIIAAAFVAAPLGLARAADNSKYLPDDFDMLVVVNVKQLGESGLVKKHGIEHVKALLKKNEEAAKTFEALGFDPFADLHSITVAVSGLDPSAKAYVIAGGKFDRAKLEAKAAEFAAKAGDKLKIHKAGDNKIFELGDDQKPGFAGIVSGDTIVISTEKDFVTECFGRAGGAKKGTVKKEWESLLKKVDGKECAYLAIPNTIFDKVPVPLDDQAKKSVDKISDIVISLNLEKGLRLTLNVSAKTADNAKELSDELKDGLEKAKGALALFAGMEPKLAPVVDLVNAIKVTTDGKSVVLTGELSTEVIEKAIPKQDQ